MKKELVISLYNRPLDWIQNINDDVKITIYRKGNLTSYPNEIYLENNVGRDVHTFFYHIVNNYNNLADYTFFSQDYPFDHVGNLIELVNGDENTWNKWATQTFEEYWAYHYNDIGTAWQLYPSKLFGGNVLSCYFDGTPHHPGLPLESIWNQLFQNKIPVELEFTPGGHFNISKKQILLKDLEYYKKILILLETEEYAPWAIERFEPYIFHSSSKIKQ
jgi:hypothetical protein